MRFMLEYLTPLPDELLLFLLCLLAFLLPFAVQLPLCVLARGAARRAGLLFPILWLAAALWALSVDETHSVIRLSPYIGGLLLCGALLALSGYGAAWLLYRLYQRKRK